MKPIIISDAMATRLDELQLPKNPQMARVLVLLYKHPDNFLYVRDLPNSMKEVDVIEYRPPTQDTHNGTNPNSGK